MNDDNFNGKDVDLKDYTIAEKAFKDLIKNGRSPMEAFGIILGMVANQFKRHGWSRQDFIDFLACLQETDWPDDLKKKPKLTLVKK
jgi:hypothetical protein